MSKLIIIIPYYNDLAGLQKTLLTVIEEIKIDVIVVDDGSEEKIKEQKIKYNGKIFFKYLQTNSGVGTALNVGLDYALENKYEFIGRLDCGDLCYKNKFSKQLKYLYKNQDVKLLGTWARVVDENQKFVYNLKHPTKYNSIKKNMYLNSMFVHPTVVFRTDILSETGKYPFKYSRAAQDYAFFFTIINLYKAENYPEILLDYVMSSTSVSKTKRKLQVYHRIRIIIDNFYFGPIPVYAVIRNLILLIIPVNILTFIKSKLYK
ncbi:glycosyltransferase [Flavobacteriaceae bacterium]|nr:glycosyltransferase [Flavobacteriaceae bacterium]MDB9712093.1 glycosyltransferase [Flavobacteriaceae bacterium]MDC1492200.1 glycosyltransferase [Flavobacteriaceae bacterium]MDC1534885.1 glycosyltransferase [Flavobacteriaceae bacterium]